MPGAGKQPPQVQEHIKELLEAGFDPTTIHRRLKVGRSSIYRMKRCLQQHGTAYMPPELNKKNGRPKVLSAEQELEVREWLRKPENRTRYLDDLVWLIHDRFGIVCSTTTMSKMKRKWLRVIEYEETGRPIDEVTRNSLLETHPDLPLLHEQPHEQHLAHEQHLVQHDPQMVQHDQHQLVPHEPQHLDLELRADHMGGPPDMHGGAEQHTYPPPQMPPATIYQQQIVPQAPLMGHPNVQAIEPQIDSQLEQQIQSEIASANVPQA